jgi:hypothetical protein
MQYHKTLIIKIGLLFLFCSSNLIAQTEVFKSNLNISDDNLSKFYSSFSMDSTQIYVNSNDYYLHAFDKKTRTLNWSHYLAYKTNTKPIVHENSIIVNKHSSDYYNKCVQLNCKTGDTIQTLKIDEIFNKPIFKDNIMFSTAITSENGGCILAYDLDKNKINWKQFIAHGVSTQPYYLKNKIVANAEGDNWFEIDFNGILKDTLCKNQASIFVDNIKCVKNYTILTHDEKQLDESFLNKNLKATENILQKSNEKITILLANENLLLIGNNKKIKQNVDLTNSLLPLGKDYNTYREILKIEEENIWFFYENLLVVYNYKSNKTTQVYDLSKWNIHQILLEEDNSQVWLISKNDGQLYGLKL